MPESSLLTETSDGVRVLTLNRPEVMNAFDEAMREGVAEAIEAAQADDAVRCVVLRGAGRAFCAGGDIASMAELQEANDTGVLETRLAVAARGVRAFRNLRKPCIAAVHGAAAGAGINLALACDFRWGTDATLFSESFVHIGLIPDWAGFYSLPRVVGRAKALEMMMTGQRVGAEEALAIGLLDRLLPAEGFDEAVMAFAARLAAGPPETLARIKEGVGLGATGSLDEVLDFEAKVQPELFLGADAREGMRAFLEKRKPRFGRS